MLPLVVGTAEPEEVAEVLDALWSEDVLPIISSDLAEKALKGLGRAGASWL